MSSSDLKTLQLQFDSLLCQQTPEQLTKLVSCMKISDSVVEDKSRLEIVRIVRNHLDKAMTDPDATDLDLFLRNLVAFVTDKPPPLKKTEEEEELARLQNTLQELKLQQEAQLKSILEQLEEAKKKVSGDITTTSRSEKSETEQKNLAAIASILHHEFKISSQIGEPAQADKLTYVSLTHQIDSGVAKGYSENEICDVTASDLYQNLVTSSQEPKETPEQFLLRALDACNKVLFGAQEETSQGAYSQQLVQNTFLKTVETGLRDENLVSNFHPFLRPPGLTDEDLMHNLNELATKQVERKAKIVFSAERQCAAKTLSKYADQPEQNNRFVSHLTPKQVSSIAKLMGKRCTINCRLNEKHFTALWDTGAQVSILSEDFVKRNFPDTKLRHISELIDSEVTLTAANGENIPYKGWVEITFKLKNDGTSLVLPFLVTKEYIHLPLIGYNVIGECFIDGSTAQELTSVFPCVSSASVNSLIEFISRKRDPELCTVKTDKHDHTVKKGQTLKVSCRLNHGMIDSDTPVLFEPEENSRLQTGLSINDRLLTIKPGQATKIAFEIENTSKHDIVVPKRTLLGRIHLVQSVTPVDVKLNNQTELSTSNSDFNPVSEIFDGEIPKHIQEIDLDGLRPLYPEVKAYIENLLNRKFI
eukprot:gene2016-2293_t